MSSTLPYFTAAHENMMRRIASASEMHDSCDAALSLLLCLRLRDDDDDEDEEDAFLLVFFFLRFSPVVFDDEDMSVFFFFLSSLYSALLRPTQVQPT
jgi:hypothetical protein